MIYLIPHSGLANRMRVIASGLSLAKKINQPISVIWNKDDGCNIDFYELFKPVTGLELRGDNWKTRLMKLIRGKKNLRWLPALISIDFYMFDENFKQYVWGNKDYAFNPEILKKNVRDIYINTCHDFYYQKEFFTLFKPIPEIQVLINKNTKKFSSKTIGIHIRRTDHKEAIRYSPLELYINEMKDDLSQDSEVNFFLATDDSETESKLKELFPGKILTADRELSRSSKAGMTGAMVDLYCLGKCSKIYGSYWSSFSDVAARIGDVPLKVMKN